MGTRLIIFSGQLSGLTSNSGQSLPINLKGHKVSKGECMSCNQKSTGNFLVSCIDSSLKH